MENEKHEAGVVETDPWLECVLADEKGFWMEQIGNCANEQMYVCEK